MHGVKPVAWRAPAAWAGSGCGPQGRQTACAEGARCAAGCMVADTDAAAATGGGRAVEKHRLIQTCAHTIQERGEQGSGVWCELRVELDSYAFARVLQANFTCAARGVLHASVPPPLLWHVHAPAAHSGSPLRTLPRQLRHHQGSRPQQTIASWSCCPLLQCSRAPSPFPSHSTRDHQFKAGQQRS